MLNKRILIIDDSEWFQETTKAILNQSGFEVVTASNGKDGIQKVYKDAPDLVLLDCVMPVMDGYAVIKELRSDPSILHIPIIMLTGQDSEYDEIKGLELGINDYIVKPFNPSVLLARIKAVLDRTSKDIAANPLTTLAGNVVIMEESEKRINGGQPFSMICADLMNFKSFNDKYGFQRGDEVIKNLAAIITSALKEEGQKGDFLGHIGGDDFVILTSQDRSQAVCERIIKQFDAGIKEFYDPVDREKGYIVSVDRKNVEQKFPIMTISLAVINSEGKAIEHYAQLSQAAAELKKLAKTYDRSVFVVDRRK